MPVVLKRDGRGIPLWDQFTGPREIMVEILQPPDDLGRSMFRAYWQTEVGWVPGGVRAQLFNVRVRAWITTMEGQHKTVRLIGDRTEIPE